MTHSRLALFLVLMGAITSVIFASTGVVHITFVAPSHYGDRADLLASTSQGAIIFDADEQVFYGRRSSESDPWIALSPPVFGAGVPVGAILPWGGAAAPQGYMLCDGEPLRVREYPALFDIIGTAFGTDMDSQGQQRFFLPNLQGVFLRGFDPMKRYDKDADTREASGANGHVKNTIGTFQRDSDRAHNHKFGERVVVEALTLKPSDKNWQQYNHPNHDWTPIDLSETTQQPGGRHESRPANITVNFIIRVGDPILKQ